SPREAPVTMITRPSRSNRANSPWAHGRGEQPGEHLVALGADVGHTRPRCARGIHAGLSRRHLRRLDGARLDGRIITPGPQPVKQMPPARRSRSRDSSTVRNIGGMASSALWDVNGPPPVPRRAAEFDTFSRSALWDVSRRGGPEGSAARGLVLPG